MRITVFVLSIFLGLIAPGCRNTQTTTTDAAVLRDQAGGAQLDLVLMRADWCAQCHVLGAKLDRVMPAFESEPVKLIVADLTDIHHPAGKAVLEQEGLGALFESNRGRTGVLYLIDAETGEVYDRVYSRASDEEIRGDIERALAKAEQS